MANYTPTFTKPYPNGWVDKPSKTTPVTAAIMDSYDAAIAALEAYLRDNAIDAVSVSVEQFPSDGRQWLGTITVGSNQYRIYMPSLKYENSVSDGTKIGVITLGEQSFDVYAPASSTGGSTVSVVPKTLTGTNIAEITVDGTTYQLYAPTSGGGSGSTVTAEATLAEGTQIGKITIDGVETILYAPTASPITVDSELSATSENAIQNKVVKAEFDKVNSNLSNLKVSDVAGGKNLLNKNKFVPNITIAKDGSIIKDDVYNLIYVPIKANIDYVFSRLTESSGSAGVVWGISNLFPSEGGTSSYNPLYSKSNKFNVKSNTDGYFLIRDRFDMHEDGTGSNWQLEEGTQATDYEPYIPSVAMLAEKNAQQSTEMLDLKMLGWSVPKECPIQNEVNGNQFVQKVGRVDLGGLGWQYDETATRFISSVVQDIKPPSSNQQLAKAFLRDYTTTAVNFIIENEGKFVGVSTKLLISVKNSSYTNTTAFKQAMQGQYLYYELATPIAKTIDGNEAISQLNSDLSNVKDGTTPVAKAVADEEGNNIKSTYATKAEAFIDYSSKTVNLNTLTTAPSLISIGYEATNKPSGFYGGYMFVVNAGYFASIALYQTLLDVFSNKTYQRKYYHGAWTDWEETNSGITIDSVLSETSTNPVQNKVVTEKLNEVFQSVSNGKSLIASAITDKGVTTEADATFQTMADNITAISTETKTSENVTYGGTGAGGLAAYYDLQAAPVQTAE